MNKEELISSINKIKLEKNAIILAHYYQEGDVQELADFVGDSLALAQEAMKTNADIIVIAGVKFMAETAKILNYKKKVLIPDIMAGCSLADSCKPGEFEEFIKKHPGAIVISYINTNIEIKALSDIICTSSNVVEIVKSIEKDREIIFAPDKNLGNYVSGILKRELIIWDGACHVHEEFSLERILEIKKMNKYAKIIAHPECKKQILLIADFIGSTSSLIKFCKNDNSDTYIVATEAGIIYQLNKICENKSFIPAPPIDSTCGCNECKFMKMNTMEKIYKSLLNEKHEILIDEKIKNRAEKPILKMMKISKKIEIN
jgi:quinolinate synthase